MTFLSIIINKLILLACKIFKRNGSVIPGYYATKFNKDVLDKLKYPKYVIGVTGSSGKGSTTSLIAHVLKNSGYKVVWNESGSNLFNAAATLFLKHTNPFTKKINADVLLMELDESYIKTIFKKQKLTHLIVTNITRDQPARNGNADLIYNKILSSIDKETKLIINADDPIVNRLKYETKCKIVTYGVDNIESDLTTPLSNTFDAAYCPLCGKKLKYDFYHYGHIGSYDCPKCEFGRDKIDYLVNKVNLKEKEITINDVTLNLDNDVLFAVYYTAATYALLKEIDVNEGYILYNLNKNMKPSKRMKEYKLDNREVKMIESKNENALSYLQSINYINSIPEEKTIILGFENVSRRYNLNDLSWLYDVDFELLNNDKIDKIFCIGRFRYDVYNRLMHAKIDKNKIILIDDLNHLIPKVKMESKGIIFTMVCFDMTDNIKKLLKEDENEKN